METIKLASNQKFETRNHGVIVNTVTKTRIFNFTSDLDISEVLSTFKDDTNIFSIAYSINDVVRDIFEDCVSFKSIHMDEAGYTVELSTDAVEKKAKETAAKVEDLEKEIALLKAAQETTQTPEPTEPVVEPEGTSTTEP